MDEEIKNLVEEYVKQIESKEADFVLLKKGIDEIISHAQKEIGDTIADLDVKFDEHNITEEEYLALLRAEKGKILQKTKKRLGSLIQGIEETSAHREEVSMADENK